LNLRLEIKETNVNLIHWQSHAGVGKLKLIGCEIDHSIYQDAKYYRGKIKDLKFYDVTNYPSTINSNA
jgi:hypothetical protein